MKGILTLVLIFCSFLLYSCRPGAPSVSSLAVIDGEPVTSPEQAPGTYAIRSYSNGEYIANASAVAIGRDTFVSSGHVVGAQIPIDRMEIVDYRGNVLTEFDPRSPDVKKVLDPSYVQSGMKDRRHDLGAFVLPDQLPISSFSQGLVPLGASRPTESGNVRLAGNGIQDYRVLADREKYADANSGVLRWGENQVAQQDPTGYFVNGFAFDTPGENGRSVSGPGDSGGGMFSYDKAGNPQLVGLLQGGSPFKVGENGATEYYDYSSNPSEVSDQPNLAYTYAVDVTNRENFFQQVTEQGGNIGIPTYYNPNTYDAYSKDDIAGFSDMYGSGWEQSAIVKSPDGLNYSGYSSGGEYKWNGNGSYQWYDPSGKASDYYTSYDSDAGKWVQTNSGSSS